MQFLFYPDLQCLNTSVIFQITMKSKKHQLTLCGVNTGNNLLCAYCLNCKIGFVTLMLIPSFLFCRSYLYLLLNLGKCVNITLMGKERPFDQ